MDILCPECKEEILLNEPCCPYCGHEFHNVPHPLNSYAHYRAYISSVGIIASLIAIFFCAGIYIQLTTMDPIKNKHGNITVIPTPVVPHDLYLTGKTLVNPTGISIKNEDGFPWKNVTVVLNHTAGNNAYSLNLTYFEEHFLSDFPFYLFHKGDGAPFDPSQTTVKNITIHGDTPQGHSHYYYFAEEKQIKETP